MSWLEDVLASIAASGEGAVKLGPPMTDREREMQALVDGGGYPAPDARNPAVRMAMGDGPAPVRSATLPFGLGGDPMTAGGVRDNGPGLPFATGLDPMTAGGGGGGSIPDMAAAQLANRIRGGNPALSFPTSQPMEKYIDYSMGWPQEATRPVAQFPDIPASPAGPAAPPQMAAHAGIPGLNSPMGGGGAPFSIAGASPSLIAAKEMTAPPPPAPNPAMAQAPIPGLVPPGAAPGVPPTPGMPPVVAQGEETPPGAPTEASAQRRAPAGPAAAPMSMAPAAPPEASFGDRLRTAGTGLAAALREASPHMIALGAGLAGQGWGTAAELAAARSKEERGLALQASQGNATARLLASKGASPQEISAAINGGPDVMKALIGQYFNKDKFSVVQTGEDKYGSKTFKVLNAADGTFKEVQARDEAEARDTVQRQELEGITGADRLAALQKMDPAYARKVQSAVNGDISLPTGKAALMPAGRKFIEDVLGVDGTVSEADFKIRQQVRKNYESGKDFQVTKSINTVVKHGALLEKAIEKLNNNNYFSALSNPARDAVLSQTDKGYIEAKKEFTVNAEIFAREMDFALSGGRPTVSGAAHQREAFDALAAQVGQKAALKKSIELLDERLQEHTRGYAESLPPGTKDSVVPKLEKKTTDFIARMTGKNAPAKPAAASGQVKVGDTVIPWSVN